MPLARFLFTIAQSITEIYKSYQSENGKGSSSSQNASGVFRVVDSARDRLRVRQFLACCRPDPLGPSGFHRYCQFHFFEIQRNCAMQMAMLHDFV